LVAVIIAAGNAVAPSLTEKIAGGMVTLVKGLFHSGGWLLMASALAVPMLVFSAFRRHLTARRKAWMLLAWVLLLSLSVTGINVAFSYIGNRFRSVLENFSLLIGWQRNLSLFTTAYSYLPVVLPFLVLFGPYFAGKIE
jgi:hypothetical protein